MEALLAKFPDNTGLLLKYAETLIRVNKITLAKNTLIALTKTKIFEPITYELLAKAKGMSGNKAGMHQATAEWYVCYGNMEAAITQLDLAVDFAKDSNILQTIIKKRKEEIEAIMNQGFTS